MSPLLDALKSQSAQRRKAARNSYLAALYSDDPRAIDDLRAFMDTLGKSVADVEGDVRAIERAHKLVQVMEEGAAADESGLRESLALQIEQFDAETHRIIEQRRNKREGLAQEHRELSHRWVDADSARHALPGLMASRPDLFTVEVFDPKIIRQMLPALWAERHPNRATGEKVSSNVTS